MKKTLAIVQIGFVAWSAIITGATVQAWAEDVAPLQQQVKLYHCVHCGMLSDSGAVDGNVPCPKNGKTGPHSMVPLQQKAKLYRCVHCGMLSDSGAADGNVHCPKNGKTGPHSMVPLR